MPHISSLAGQNDIGRTWHGVDEIAGYFQGAWRLQRRIEDRKLGITGRLTGHVQFQPHADGLLYDESGSLAMGSYQGQSTCRYRYEIISSEQACVRFEDGGLFHPLDVSTGEACVRHHCGADLYRGYYRVMDRNHWMMCWWVEGPRKNLLIISRFQRAAADPND